MLNVCGRVRSANLLTASSKSAKSSSVSFSSSNTSKASLYCATKLAFISALVCRIPYFNPSFVLTRFLGRTREAVKVYQNFRQGVNFARNKGQLQNRPGRSRYPEADTLREMTSRFGHSVSHPVRGFPRADLGLPIIFHFQGHGEPADQTLQGRETGQQRFASPVIAKAAVVDGQFVPLVMVLDSPHVWQGRGVEFKGLEAVEVTDLNLSEDKLSKIPPLHGLPIREAFKKFIRENGFQEEPL